MTKRRSPAPCAQDPLPDYIPVTLGRARHDGWTAERQRTFLVALAETGCISEACRISDINARSAYRLRAHPSGAGFADAWDQALRYATGKLMTLAYERAIRGSIREVWHRGLLVGETRQPSDRLLMFLLAKLAPQPPAGQDAPNRWADLTGASGDAAVTLSPALEALADCPVIAEPLSSADFMAVRPTDPDPRVAPFDDDATIYGERAM